ncbi:hypothetical protein NA56DRAFT_743910 [Hyaloscypha hepaticicola]|uniref:Uncharacterized protein n=1 Tax=Hyaloscypha hepaticicola TaxID=2082293 RepID=A0A2J6QJX2_9HELO|nr:hypothetical protein NA56DRAFT_743910 [Hyaloscypha hepaticicola]
MDTSEFTHQVNLLLSCLRDRANNCLGTLHTLTPSKSTMIATLFRQPGSRSTDSRTYTTKILAIASPNTKARITMPLLNKLEILKTDGPGWKTTYLGAEYQFVVEDVEPSSPSDSSSVSSEEETELGEDVGGGVEEL